MTSAASPLLQTPRACATGSQLKLRVLPHTRIAQSQYAVRHADHVLCCSEDDRRYLVQRGVPPGRLTRHRNGISDAFLAACATQSPSAGNGVLFMGSWLLRKGILETVAAVTGLLRTHPAATFTAAGTGVPRETVLAQLDADGRPRITVLSSIDSDRRLVELYRQHRILLLPSLFEGQPLVMIEAAAAQMAIVTTGICGMRDFVEDGVNGRLVRVGDAAATARVLEELWNAPVVAERLGAAARKTAEEHTWSHAASLILAAYERTVQTSAVAVPAAQNGG